MTVNVKNDRTICSNVFIIGKTYENKATTMRIHIEKEMATKEFYLEFEKANGDKLSTPRLDIVVENEQNIYVDFPIPNTLLDVEGNLKCEVVLRSENEVWKSYPLLFNVLPSINASQEYETDYPDFIEQAQKILDECERKEQMIVDTGSGTKFLADDGVYKTVEGSSPVKYVESKAEEPVVIRDLVSGTYVLNGKFCVYAGSKTISFVNVLVALVRNTTISYLQVFYPPQNRIQYMEATDENYTIKQISLNTLEERVKALEEKVGA